MTSSLPQPKPMYWCAKCRKEYATKPKCCQNMVTCLIVDKHMVIKRLQKMCNLEYSVIKYHVEQIYSPDPSINPPKNTQRSNY